MKTFEVVLGGQTYTLHPFNIGELEDITDATQNGVPSKAGFAILRIALRRAEPAIADPNLIEATSDELRVAIEKVMSASGMSAAPGETKPAG